MISTSICSRVSAVTQVNSDTCVSGKVEKRMPMPPEDVIDASDPETADILKGNIAVYQDFITEEEEHSLFDEVEPHLKRLRYEKDHWDDAIHGYREMERNRWSAKNKIIIERVRKLIFPPDATHIAYVHVLDLMPSGYIKAHVDSVRFCGSTIAGMCLLSSSIMRFVNEKDKFKYVDVLLKQRSLYVMRDRARYEYTHEILAAEQSYFRGNVVSRDRRISIICRNKA
ncbi:hypothetical protein LSAT2_030632 [Lamellibrachia satsuma]|nr:hypothetical protein LSAT2_030632 [Lamellibrachia satsuma]